MSDRLIWTRRRDLFVEGGVYFLLVFCPLAFGAVEDWAIGLIQMVTWTVFAAWAWDRRPGRLRQPTVQPAPRPTRAEWLGWGSIAAFVLLLAASLVPLPRAVLSRVAPGSDSIYAMTVPGYAAPEPGPIDRVSWLINDPAITLPAPGTAAATRWPERTPPAAPAGWRTTSIYPFRTASRLGLLIAYIVLFIVVSGSFITREKINRLLRVAVGSTFIVSLLGILQKLSQSERLLWIRSGDYKEIFGPFVNRNSYAALAVTVLPVALALAVAAHRRGRSGQMRSVPGLLGFGFSAAVIAGGIFYSLSRGGMIAAGIAVVLLSAFLFTAGERKLELLSLPALVIPMAAFVMWIGSEEVVERMGTLAAGSGTPSMAARLIAWQRAFGVIGENLLVGSGLGTFAFAIQRYSPPGHAWWTTAHNEYIELLADTGILGFLLIMIALGAYVTRVFRPGLFRHSRRACAWAGLCTGIASLLLHSLVSADLQVPAIAVLLVVLAAALLNVVRVQEGRTGRRRGRPAASLPPHPGLVR
ncbi:MAG: O-antigen ligase family protein [Acidobacteriota bacterium]